MVQVVDFGKALKSANLADRSKGLCAIGNHRLDQLDVAGCFFRGHAVEDRPGSAKGGGGPVGVEGGYQIGLAFQHHTI